MRRAFTIVELLTVVGIVAVLSGILMPVFGLARTQARRVETVANLRQLGIGLNAYRVDYDGADRGTVTEMGLPHSPVAFHNSAYVPAGLPLCTSGRKGVDPMFGITKILYIKGFPANLTLWAKDVDRYGDAAITYAAPCFSDPVFPLNSPHFRYDVSGLELSGSVRRRVDLGDWSEQSWWHDPRP